jgi:hypothetical protein
LSCSSGVNHLAARDEILQTTQLPPPKLDFLPGVPERYVLARLTAAAGEELQSGKFASPDSSAALAVNTFGWFHERPHLLPAFAGLLSDYPARTVDVEACVRFPWSGGRHPWLDALVTTPSAFVGVESKRYEPFRDKKSVDLSDAYDRPVWGEAMGPFEQVRDALRAGLIKYERLDAAQLVKHAFGLTTQARRAGLRPILVYLFAEPTMLAGRPLRDDVKAQHRQEITDFTARVAGADVAFHASSYREWLGSWAEPAEVVEHGRRVLERFAP